MGGAIWAAGIAGWLVMAWLCGQRTIKMALARNRRPHWALWCYPFGPLPLGLLAALPPKPYTSKRCGDCLASIPVEAAVCPQCGHDVSALVLIRRRGGSSWR